MNVNLEKIRRRCERMVRWAAPLEFGALPIYCVFDSELPPDARLQGGATGRVWMNFDLCFRPFIKRWRGRGPCFVLSGSELESANSQRHANAEGVAIALHEASHLLADGMNTFEVEVEPADLPTPAEAMTGTISPDDPRRVALFANLYAHDHRFIRALCHARYRVAMRGVATGSLYLGVVGGIAPCMSNLFSYDVALLDEMKASLGVSFSDILKQPPPPAMAMRWNDDVADVVKMHGGEDLAEGLWLK